MEIEYKYKSEYAASGRAGCKFCKKNIEKGILRLAVMVQSAFHDGKNPNWFHFDCFFQKQRPQTEGDFEGFENLRYADQTLLKDRIGSVTDVVMPSTSKGKKGKKRTVDAKTSAILNDFGVEYSKSARATCAGCQQKISKGVVRIKKVVYDTEVGMKFGGQPIWHHTDCFAKLRSDLGWYETGEILPGFKSLSKDDQKIVKDAIPALAVADVPPVKKLKEEVKDETDAAEDKKKEDTIAKQNKQYFKYRDYLQSHLTKPQWIQILEYNGQSIPEDYSATEKVLDLTSDNITFGALKPCDKCKGQFVFNKSGYMCTGYATEYTKCLNMVETPAREPCKIPSAINNEHSIFKTKGKVQDRVVKYVPPSAPSFSFIKKDEIDGPKIQREKPPLYLMEFAIIGKTSKSKDKLKVEIEKLGGKLGAKIHENLVAVISNPDEVEKMNLRMEDAKKYGLQVITDDFVDRVGKTNAIEYITANSICDWGTDPTPRIPQESAKSGSSKSIYTKSVPKSLKLKLQNGTAVDPDSGLVDVGHVYVDGKTKYFAILGKTDIQSNKNSYYKIQLIESENRREYYVFKSWGRIGTTIGGTNVKEFGDIEDARVEFENLYEERTGNMFNFGKFKKQPGKYSPIDVDFGETKATKKLSDSKIKSNLHVKIQDLIKLIFDVDTMKKTMLEFDLDMEKMPLGKLSQKQLNNAMKVLNELSTLISGGGTNTQFIDASNRFYNLVPHDFGVQRPPLIDTTEMINDKVSMIESLMEIEIAFGLLNASDENGSKSDTAAEQNPIDLHYKQLKTDMTVLDSKSEEFKILEKYVQNTHASTHSSFKLIIESIYKVNRKGEERRYKPFKKLHNRKLLWHGSRLTNFVGILSHGLKIAPPEAPVTGYMFGKGIYFADMVSKSANYCCTSKQNNTGLMLLCEVALGDMYECLNANYVTQLPAGKHSTKGCGKTTPDSTEIHVRSDGVEIPFGKPTMDTTIKSSLLYNEFIVYDVAQVNCQYLFKMKFDYQY